MEYIIVQAGGRGSRLHHLTKNKPKALVSVYGMPLIFKLFQQHPSSKFIIIGDYKIEVFKKYLKNFSNVDYKLIKANKKGTCSGVQQALKFIPKNKFFALMWCDLYLKEPIPFKKIITKDQNYIGLSKEFSCRWMFKNNKLNEKRSKKYGVAGIYIFKNKAEIIDVPQEGEFCNYLKNKNTLFQSFELKNIVEIGTIDDYKKFTGAFLNTRPFNNIRLEKKYIIKTPTNKQGQLIAKKERSWYKWVNQYKFNFIPKIYEYSPLKMQRINGRNIFDSHFSNNEKYRMISQIIKNLKTIHNCKHKTSVNSIYANDKEVILNKTKRRLDSVIDLIPFSSNQFIYINGKKCINFYKKWDLVINISSPFLGKNNYSPIHGDLTFSNILINKKKKIFFIDPRGYYGSSKITGDIDYDWSKLFYSISGNYDQFNAKNFTLEFQENSVLLKIHTNGWEKMTTHLFQEIGATTAQKDKIRFYHAIIWLSLTSYAWDDYDSICGSFYNGILLMQKVYEKLFKKTT